jgi:hypothetical protein
VRWGKGAVRQRERLGVEGSLSPPSGAARGPGGGVVGVAGGGRRGGVARRWLTRAAAGETDGFAIRRSAGILVLNQRLTVRAYVKVNSC